MARTKTKIKSRWIVKAGSNMIVSGGPLLIRAWMQQVEKLRNEHGIEVVWVTSGAIASATERTKFATLPGKTRTLAEKQALASVGQPLVMDQYNIALNAVGLLGAQILLTYDDLANADRKKNFQNTAKQLLRWGVTPILNENDAVATQEIRFGDNDQLSARVAHALGADRLVILTDVEGLYDSDPRKNKRARLVHELKSVSSEWIRKVSGAGAGSKGTGGMHSKLLAARFAQEKKIETILARGDIPGVLERLAVGEGIGTRIRRAGGRNA